MVAASISTRAMSRLHQHARGLLDARPVGDEVADRGVDLGVDRVLSEDPYVDEVSVHDRRAVVGTTAPGSKPWMAYIVSDQAHPSLSGR